jgi:integrase
VENVLDDEFPNFRNIINKIESPALQAVREKTVLTDEQVYLLLDTLTKKKQYEKACVIALLMFSGRRKSELTRFRVSDFGDGHVVCGGALYKSDPIQTKGRAGGKYIPCYVLKKSFDPYLERWLKYREENGINSEWLFPHHTKAGESISVATLDSWTEQFSRILGVPFYYHAGRHRFTTYLAKAGIPDGVIQSIVAWESSDMVRLYKDIDADEEIGMWFKDGEIAAPEQSGFGAL